MKIRILTPVCLALGLGGMATAAEPTPASDLERPTVIIVAGAPGDREFQPDLDQQMASWARASEDAGARHVSIGAEVAGEPDDRSRLKAALENESREGAAELWLVLAGHGTFDGKEAKFNLRGADLSATDLAEWLKPIRRPVAIVDASSSSAPFLAKLAGANRVIVTSTRSGYEQNYARFGKFLAAALPDPKSDLDKDGQISLLEAFLSASHRTAEFYKTEGRLATEHALIDDNGDGLGTPSEWFRGIRAEKKTEDGAPVDGQRAHQFHLVRSAAELQLSAEARARRDQIELEIARLRERKGKITDEAYYRELEEKLLALAAVYDGT